MRRMTTSQRVPRRALLRRVGPWVALAAILTGCASPAAQSALTALEDQCRDTAASTATCATYALLVQPGPPDAGTGIETAVVATSTTGRTDVTPERAAKDTDKKRPSTRKSTKPRTESATRKRTTTPRRTARVPKVRMPAISAAYYGAGVTVARFKVSGDTRSQILRSIRTRGPHGGASGVTQPYLKYRFTFKYDRKGRCHVVRTGSAAVTVSVRVTLPTWSATTGTDRSTASWWADELRETAAHERHHVRLWRGYVRQANRIVATSSCSKVGDRLNALWRKAAVANCRFDNSEYGISMRACLRR
jgi:predicted secreted Zn-dependent protease